MIIDLVEYEPSTRADRIVRKVDQEYCGVGPRPSDGFTCLSIRTPGAGRRHHIEVGQLHAITIHGRRHVLQTPWDRWRLRAQEVIRLLDGDFSEEWAREYFDPTSPKYFAKAADYIPPAPEQGSAGGGPSHLRYDRGKTSIGYIALAAALLALWWFFGSDWF